MDFHQSSLHTLGTSFLSGLLLTSLSTYNRERKLNFLFVFTTQFSSCYFPKQHIWDLFWFCLLFCLANNFSKDYSGKYSLYMTIVQDLGGFRAPCLALYHTNNCNQKENMSETLLEWYRQVLLYFLGQESSLNPV